MDTTSDTPAAPKSLDDVLAQVAKLQALASRAGTEGEARAAVAAIQRLVARYRLTQHDLQTAEARRVAGEGPRRQATLIATAKKMPYWQNCLLNMLCFHNGCVAVKTEPLVRGGAHEWYAYGELDDVAIVRQLFVWLGAEATRLAPQETRIGKSSLRTTPRFRDDWRVGFVEGLHEQLSREDPVASASAPARAEASRALVVLDQRRQAATADIVKQDPYAKTKTPKARAVIAQAYEEGVRRGKQHHLGKSLGDGKETR